jgi:hypothetical protein
LFRVGGLSSWSTTPVWSSRPRTVHNRPALLALSRLHLSATGTVRE